MKLEKFFQTRVGDGGGGGDGGGRIFPEHPSPILHAPRDIISRKGKSLTPIYGCVHMEIRGWRDESNCEIVSFSACFDKFLIYINIYICIGVNDLPLRDMLSLGA